MKTNDALTFYKVLPKVPHVANPYLARSLVEGVPRRASSTTDKNLIQECHQAVTKMQQAPYDVTFIPTVANSLATGNNIYLVNLTTPLSNDVKVYDLINVESKSGKNYVVQRNWFHDSVGSGGRIIGKAIDGVMVNNTMERFGGVHIYSEQQWLEGALGIRNVVLKNNTVVDARVGQPTHMDVMMGLKNVTCMENTFVVNGSVTERKKGC